MSVEASGYMLEPPFPTFEIHVTISSRRDEVSKITPFIMTHITPLLCKYTFTLRVLFGFLALLAMLNTI
jgi:hypothetical protein